MESKLKYRNVYGQPDAGKWEDVKATQATCDSCLAKANSKYVAFSHSSKGALGILNLKKRGRMAMDLPLIMGHQGTVQDFEFVPFNENYVVSSGEDGIIKVWEIPETFDKSISTEQLSIVAHQKKINLLAFNESSEGILASTSFDSTVKIWDLLKAAEKFSINCFKDRASSLLWNKEGSLIGANWSDKSLRVIDPRLQKIILETQGHEGGKPQKFCWLGSNEKLLTTGFSKLNEREFKIWDIRNFQQAISIELVDKGVASILYPFFDQDLGILYLTGKGDGQIKYYEYTDEKFNYYRNPYMSNAPGKAYGVFPKYSLDVNTNEIARFVKILDNSVELISFINPRKSTQFQEDNFPDCYYDSAQSANEWFAGKNSEPKRRSMDPSKPTQIPNAQHKLTFAAQSQNNNKIQNQVVEQQQQPQQQQKLQQEQPKQLQKLEQEQKANAEKKNIIQATQQEKQKINNQKAQEIKIEQQLNDKNVNQQALQESEQIHHLQKEKDNLNQESNQQKESYEKQIEQLRNQNTQLQEQIEKLKQQSESQKVNENQQLIDQENLQQIRAQIVNLQQVLEDN